MTSTGPYYLLLVCDCGPVQYGWWGREETAREKFRRWVGEYGTMPGVRITLTDETAADLLAAWPSQP